MFRSRFGTRKEPHAQQVEVSGRPELVDAGVRDLILTENITLDGVIDAADGWFNPAGGDVDQSDLESALREQREAAGAVLLGRVTFEQMRGYWRQQTNDSTGITDYLNTVLKYVVSSSLTESGWEHTTVLRGDPMEEIQALKSEPGKDIVVTGSMTLASALIAGRMVDEYRLFTYPVVLGRGRRLFENATQVPKLRLVESQRFRSDVVLLRYRATL